MNKTRAEFFFKKNKNQYAGFMEGVRDESEIWQSIR